MNVKRYIAEDAREAMDKVRHELGGDAYILNTRKIRRKGVLGAFKKPMYEVVAAYDPKIERKAVRKAAGFDVSVDAGAAMQPLELKNALTGDSVRVPDILPQGGRRAEHREHRVQEPGTKDILAIRDALLSDAARRESAYKPENPELNRITELERKIDSMVSIMEGIAAGQGMGRHNEEGLPDEVGRLVSALESSEVATEFALRVGKEAANALSRREADPHEVCAQIIQQYIGDPSPIKLKKFGRSVIMLAGPTGVGKTTTLAKLAADYSINQKVKVGLVTTDTYRIAAVEQLRTYAEILDLPLATAYTPADMKKALEDYDDCDLVLIDTAGRSPGDSTVEKELSSFMAEANPDEVHLCVSAATGFSGCRKILETYKFLSGHKLLITKLDETPAWGAALNVRFLTDRPISYASFGQGVPDDIEILDARKVADKLLSL